MKEPLTSLSTEPLTAEREWTADGVPALSAAVTVPEPVPCADRTARRIRRYYQLQCRSFLHYCEKVLLPQAAAEVRAALAASRPLPVFRAELTYQVTHNEGGLWSLYTQSRETVPGAPSLLLRRGDTWDLSDGYPVPLSAFFPPAERLAPPPDGSGGGGGPAAGGGGRLPVSRGRPPEAAAVFQPP